MTMGRLLAAVTVLLSLQDSAESQAKLLCARSPKKRSLLEGPEARSATSFVRLKVKPVCHALRRVHGRRRGSLKSTGNSP